MAALWLGGTAAQAQPLEHDEHKYSEWQSDEHTWFAASATDVGIVYVRPHLTLGWGAPFWQFVAFDGYALATNSFAAAYAGWRASLPFLDVQMGGRWTRPYDRRFLPEQDSYVADDLYPRDGDESPTYRLVELEITPLAPLLGGVAFIELHPLWVEAPSDRYVFEEVTRVVIAPPFAMRTRLGYVYPVLESGDVKLGGMLEYLVLPGRPGNVTRVGPLALLTFAPRIEGLFTWTMVLSSPDDLGPYEGSYGFLGVRFRWAQRF